MTDKKKKDWIHRRGGQGGRRGGYTGARPSGTPQDPGHGNSNYANNRNANAQAHGHGRGHSVQATDKSKRPRYDSSHHGPPRHEASHNQNRQHNHQRTPITQRSHSDSTSEARTSAVPTSTTQQQEPAPVTVREIPGFYYDTEKKKYFKITANHTLGSQHPFSQQSIKEKSTPKPVLDPIRKEVGPRFPIASKHYRRLDWFLQDRPLGMTGNPRRQLCDMHAMLVRHWKRNRRVEPILAENGAKYTHLEIDPIRRDLYLGTHQRELWRYHCSENALETKYQWMRLNGDSSELTSLHLTRDNNIITTYLGGMGRSGTVQIQQGLVDTSWSTEPRSQTLLSFSPKKSNVWTSALSEDKIVLGADQKVILLLDYKRLVQSNCNFIHSDHIQNLWIGSDVFSVAVEPVDRKQNLVYAGCRNGSVRIFDLDQPGTFTSGPDPKEHLPFMREKRARSILEGIGHRDSSTQSLRRVGEHYLVTGAMNGEISMWDKRFVSSRGGSHTTSTTSTVAKSVLDFRTKVQDQFTKIRFDLNVEETLLAAENLNRTVSLWSIKTGERLKDLEVNGAVSSLKFSPDQQGVWVAVGDRVQFWGFGD